MVFENFTPAARRVIVLSQEEASKGRRLRIDASHLLLALAAPLLGTDSSRALALLGASEAEIRARVKGHRRRAGLRARPAHIPFTPEVKQVILAAVRDADARGQVDVGSGDLLLALAQRSWLGGQILADLGAGREALVSALAWVAPAEDLTTELDDVPHPVMQRPASWQPGPDQLRQADGHARAPAKLSVRCSAAAAVSPERAWSLLGSPQAWCLGPSGRVMLDVPDADRLRLLVGPAIGDHANDSRCVLLGVSEPPDRQEVRLTELAPGQLSYTLSVVPHRRGQAELRVTVRGTTARDRAHRRAAKRTLSRDLQVWLQAMCRVLEGREPWPGADIPARLLTAWAAPQRMEQPRRHAASDLVAATPELVWNTIHEPWAPQTDPDRPLIHSGRIPGAPVGEIGEMWYFIHCRPDGSLAPRVEVVTQRVDRQLTVTQSLEPLPMQTTYLLSQEAGGTRLEMTCQVPTPLVEFSEHNRRKLAGFARKSLAGYKTYIEAASGSVADREAGD